MESNSYTNIRTQLGSSPKDFDLSFAPIDARGGVAKLNSYVLSNYGYSSFDIEGINLEEGYATLERTGSQSIIFIVTVGNGETVISLKNNLKNALLYYNKWLFKKDVWIPLMGTGAGKLSFAESYFTTLEVLKEFPEINFNISIPYEDRGISFIENYEIINLVEFESFEGSVNLKTEIKGSNNVTANLKDKQENTNFDEKFKLHRFLRDVLNKEHHLNLVIEESRVIKGINIELDLVDDEAKAYAVLINKEDFLDLANNSKFKAGNREDRIMSTIYSEILIDLEMLSSNKPLNKYFAFFDESFTNENIQEIKQGTKNEYKDIVEILDLADVFKLSEKHNFKYSDYLINKIEEEDKTEDNNTDKIPFHLDNVETIDRLNREPVAKSLARLINNEIFTSEALNNSFMIHLQGEWGSGKSTFLNLLEKNLNTQNQKWIVINYNAWQNQHILPPWWSFIDQIYRQGKSKLANFKDKCILNFRENKRRIVWYSGWHKIMTLVIAIIFLGVLIIYGESLAEVVSGAPKASDSNEETKGITLDVFAGLILSIGSIVGLIYSLSKFLSTPFLMKSSDEAKSFLLRASDPMNRIKKHFNKLISNINDQGYQVAVFIDDIDRCNVTYTVSLLEGIQTLFKDKKVLYVVAGDKNWISTCFQNNYTDFAETISRNNEQLGDLFLEKAFQLSVRMPNVSERTKEKYWHHILGIGNAETDKKVELNETQKVKLKQEIAKNIEDGNIADSELLKTWETEFNTSEEVISDLVIETFDEKPVDIKHLFINHFALVNPNPRAIKRLANNYTMYRNTLLAERKNFNPNKLFRWLILDDMYPVFSKNLLKTEDRDDVIDAIQELNINTAAQTKLETLLFDEDNLHGGKIEINDIKDILGL